MRRSLVLVVLIGLLAGYALAPAEAKKKKPKPAPVESVDTTFFMRRDECGGAADNPHLSLVDGEDVDCGISDQMLADVYEASGQIDPRIPYVATDGLPLVLDATRPIAGTVTVRNWNGAGAGNVQLDLALVGSSGGEEKVIGTFSTTFVAVPTMAETVEYEMTPDSALNGLSFDSLTLQYFAHGQTVGIAGMVEHDEPPSLITIPSLVQG